MNDLVTVVLNGYKRPHVLREQFDAYQNQSIGIPQIMFWANLENGMGNIPFDKHVVNNSVSAFADRNHGVWARFAYALNARTPYICVVDDDTIPGKRWLENCLRTIQEKKQDAVLTTRGVMLKSNMYPSPDSYEVFGWSHPNEEIQEVDFGGHCWFFHTRILRMFWALSPDVLPLNFGEDMHLSYAAYRFAKIRTFVPKHPKDDTELWGSLPEAGMDYGQELVATSRRQDAIDGMNQYYQWMMNNGYVHLLQREKD